MREHDIPLYSLETFTPVGEFDIVGFTLQYEMSYTNILNMLELAHIPLTWKERDEVNAPFCGLRRPPAPSTPNRWRILWTCSWWADGEADSRALRTLQRPGSSAAARERKGFAGDGQHRRQLYSLA